MALVGLVQYHKPSGAAKVVAGYYGALPLAWLRVETMRRGYQGDALLATQVMRVDGSYGGELRLAVR